MVEYPVRYRKAVTYVAVDGSFAGFLALSDTLRQESAETIAALSNLGVQPVLRAAWAVISPWTLRISRWWTMR